VKSVPVNMANF